MSSCIACHEEPPYGLYSMLGGRCFGRLRADLATVQWAHGWLGSELVALAPAFKPGSIHAAAASRPPMNLGQHDVRVQIEGVLWSWTRMILEEIVPALRGPRTTDVPTVARWLRERLPWVSDQPWADEFVREVRELRQSAYAVAPWDAQRSDMPLPCPRCGLLALAHFQGSDCIVCRSLACGVVLTWEKYRSEVSAWWERAQTRREVMAA
jgi:hypothetical protein